MSGVLGSGLCAIQPRCRRVECACIAARWRAEELAVRRTRL